MRKKILSSSPTSMHERLGMANYGVYYGAIQLKKLAVVNQYIAPAVDAVDNAAKIHDQAYDAVKASAEYPDTWAAIEADKSLVLACTNLYNLPVGSKDPFNGQPITNAERYVAHEAMDYFKMKIGSKIDDVSDFMEKNYAKIAHKASGFFNDNEELQEKNYILFRDMYMTINDKGQWTQKDGMWENKNGEIVPKTNSEIKPKNK